MLHNIVLPQEEFKKIENGKRYLVTRDSSLYANGDELTISLSGYREQLNFTIQNIERRRLFKGWCILEFINALTEPNEAPKDDLAKEFSLIDL